MKTNRDESKADVLALTAERYGYVWRVYLNRQFIARNEKARIHNEVAAGAILHDYFSQYPGDFESEARIEFCGPAPVSREEGLSRICNELLDRASQTAKDYRLPVTTLFTVHHEPAYVPGQRDYAKLTEAAKRKPVGYVTTKEEAKLIENVGALAGPPVYKTELPAAPATKPDSMYDPTIKQQVRIIEWKHATQDGRSLAFVVGKREDGSEYKYQQYADVLTDVPAPTSEADRLEGTDKYEPLEALPVVGDKIAHPNSPGYVTTVTEVRERGKNYYWNVLTAGCGSCGLDASGYGWRILRRQPAKGARAETINVRAWRGEYGTTNLLIGGEWRQHCHGKWQVSKSMSKLNPVDYWLSWLPKNGHVEITDPAEVGRLVEECRKALNL